MVYNNIINKELKKIKNNWRLLIMKKVFSYGKLGEMEIGDVIGRKIYMGDCFDSMSLNGNDVMFEDRDKLKELGIVENDFDVFIKCA